MRVFYYSRPSHEGHLAASEAGDAASHPAGVEVGLGVRDAVDSRHGRPLRSLQHLGLHLWKISGSNRGFFEELGLV